jgi:hypothetical protein
MRIYRGAAHAQKGSRFSFILTARLAAREIEEPTEILYLAANGSEVCRVGQFGKAGDLPA